MPRVLRPVGHEDRLSVVGHLDELRQRLFVAGGTLLAAFIVCFIFNQTLLHLLNKPLHQTNQQANHLSGLATDSVKEHRAFVRAEALARQLSLSPHLAQSDRTLIGQLAGEFGAVAKALPRNAPPTVPITIGVGEPFTTTLTVCFYFALLIALPVLLYEAYAFIIPALSAEERKMVLPIVLAAPFLFVLGVVFSYLIVLPPAVRFLQGYNSNNFNALVQAKPLYSFEVLTMGAIGLAFQMPIGLLGLQRAGIINGSTLTRHWRYATVIIAVIAAAMPGADPVTTGLETAPLVILFLISIVMLKIVDRRDARRAMANLTELDEQD